MCFSVVFHLKYAIVVFNVSIVNIAFKASLNSISFALTESLVPIHNDQKHI